MRILLQWKGSCALIRPDKESIKEIVKPEDVDFLSQSAMDDACRPGNPRDPKFEEIKELFLSLM